MAEYQDLDTVNRQITAGSSVMFVLYTILIAAAIHNTIRIVLKEERYKSIHMASFYILVYLVAILRVIDISLILSVVINNDNPDTVDWKQGMKSSIFYIDIITTYLELLIGT